METPCTGALNELSQPRVCCAPGPLQPLAHPGVRGSRRPAAETQCQSPTPRRACQPGHQLVQAVMWRGVLRGPEPLPVFLAEATGRALRCQQLSITPSDSGGFQHLDPSQPSSSNCSRSPHHPRAPQFFRLLLGRGANWIWAHLSCLIRGRPPE